MSKLNHAVVELHRMDALAARKLWVNRIHPMVKLLLTFFYLVILVSFGKYQLAQVLMTAVYLVIGFSVAELSYLECLKRFRLILPLLLFMTITNPYFDRTVISYWGNIPITGGVCSMFTLFLKGLFSLMACYLLIATTPMTKICDTLSMIHIPRIFVTMLLLTYRYLSVLLEETERMRQAYHLRAPKEKGIHYRAWGAFLGQLLLRSMDRAETIYQSMLLRGYEHKTQEKTEEKRDMGTSLIQIEKLHFAYEEQKEILSGISFTADTGESIGLIGANGMGKSTLLKILVGLLPYEEGKVSVNGTCVEKENYAKIREQIGYVFQDSDSQLFMSNVYDDVSFGPLHYGYSKEEADERTKRALEMVHLSDFEEKQIYKLSGGEKKLVSIATILALSPQVILMDEPTVALDPSNRRNLIHILQELKQVKIVASHDLDMVWECCERVILLDHGKIVADGDTKEILSNEKLLLEHHLELPLRLQK